MRRGAVFPASKAKSLLNPLRRLVQSPQRTVRAMHLEGATRVLELGAGPGFFSPSIAKAVTGSAIVADLQPEMVRMARARLGCTAVACDALALPFADGAFDAVVLATMLGEVPDARTCIGEVHRVLSADGHVAIAETRRDSDFIAIGALRALVEAQLFAFDGRSGPSWQYVARFRRR